MAGRPADGPGGGPVLRIVDRRLPGGGHRVTVTLHGDGLVPREADNDLDVAIDQHDADRIRWYLEDYAENPATPGPQIAAAAETVLADTGTALFGRTFTGDARDTWTLATAGPGGLSAVRVEVDADPDDTPGLPWELLRNPANGQPLVLSAREFVRTHRRATQTASVPAPSGARLRVLLVICRPGGSSDVPFRSVAARLVRGGTDQIDHLDLDVLRPPTYTRLAQVLRAAKDAGRPYHVVHFDGHGTWTDATTLTGASNGADASDRSSSGAGTSGGDGGVPFSPHRYAVSLAGPVRSGRHGYLLSEDPTVTSNQLLVDGPTLAGLLVETGVPVLVLNACRSAYTEPQTPSGNGDNQTPAEDGSSCDPSAGPAVAGAGDVHGRVRAYGSLAAEVADAGVPGVIAMRYNVYVVTAAQFVADLYAHLVAGHSLGRAATLARKTLATNPTREVAGTRVDLQDWVVPTVYEPLPLHLLHPVPATTGNASSRSGEDGPVVRIRIPGAAAGDVDQPGEGSGLDLPGVPAAPDAGFYGRDETLLALDRAFDTHPVVLLWALAGAGKTTTAAEFARWYTATGGLDHPELGVGPVLWTSFEHHTPLERALDAAGAVFAPLLEANGIAWAAITDPTTRRDVILQVLNAVPVLWVWDNVEPVTGFPPGTPSPWTPDEQDDLAQFLRDAAKTRAKILLTSRRDETPWLAALPVRVQLPDMPTRERLQLTHALVAHLTTDQTTRRALTEVDWRPLLRFTGGNPLTITVTVRQALREHLHTSTALAEYVDRLRAGLAPLEDDTNTRLGRDQSLAASLGYGFTHTFTPHDHQTLALLHLFRDTINVDALRYMGDPDIADADALPQLTGLTRDTATALLDTAAAAGLLTDLGGGYYGIHPALPWYFTTLYHQHIGAPGSPTAHQAERAYARALTFLTSYFYGQVQVGEIRYLGGLRAEEANLLYALHLARTHHLPIPETGTLQGLHLLYDRTGRTPEWHRLLNQVTDDYITTDPATGTEQPRPGLEDHYTLVTGWRVNAAISERNWPLATSLQTARTAWDRDRAAPHLNTPTHQLDDRARRLIHALGLDEQDLGNILYRQQDPACLTHYKTQYELMGKAGDVAGQAVAASKLGNTYLAVPALRDVDQAEHWHQRHLDLTPEQDRISRGGILGNLANVAYARFLDARDAGATDEALLGHLEAALAGHRGALSVLPPDHHEYQSNEHHQIGTIYAKVGQVQLALHHYQQSITHREALGDAYFAGLTRYNIAVLLAGAGRPGDALAYAQAALDNFQTVGPGAAPDTQDTKQLIRYLRQQPTST